MIVLHWLLYDGLEADHSLRAPVLDFFSHNFIGRTGAPEI